jgi:hypothetical protein
MDVEIITTPMRLHLHGFGGIAANNDYAVTAFKLSGRMWEIVKSKGIKNEGKNIWVYGPGHSVFAGVRLLEPAGTDHGLEIHSLTLEKHAYFRHTGAYDQIGRTGREMRAELEKKGCEVILPYIEIYGHWNSDVSKLETGLLMCLK